MNVVFSRKRDEARGGAIALALVLCACGASVEPPRAASAPGDELAFEGSWSAAGSRKTIALGGERKGALIDLRGSMLLAGAGRPGTGFRADAIALVDSQTGLVGRSVWTDERGDQVYSELKGEGTKASNRITGTLLGGTGRYAGATGSYEFSWQFVLEAEDGTIQGRASGLKGRVRLAQAGTGGSRP
jgi:hypothetical protein